MKQAHAFYPVTVYLYSPRRQNS